MLKSVPTMCLHLPAGTRGGTLARERETAGGRRDPFCEARTASRKFWQHRRGSEQL
jgi:hypothetical protein